MAKVLLLCQDIVGANMAGPGIRYWELANALARDHEVTLAVPNEPDIRSDRFAIVSYAQRRVATFMADHEVMVAQVLSAAMLHVARRDGVRLVVDAYDPALLEVLEIARDEPLDRQRAANRRHRVETGAALLFADAVICASEKQRDLWLGALMALGRLTPDAYREDVSLRSLVAVVPFGTQEADPRRTGPGFRARLGIEDTDKVLLWGGGIWNWFDPLTLIRAMDLLRRRRDDVKLVFLGLKHPNAAVPEMAMTQRAIALAEELGLRDSSVFFNFGWVPYEERQNHFLEADIGLSTHFDHLETRFSFRTRLLDYFWAGLPIVATKGDSMADLILQRDLGRTVDFEDPQGLAAAVEELLDDEPARRAIAANLRQVREEYRWSRVAEPLSAIVARLGTAPPRGLTWPERRALAELYRERLRTERGHKGLRGVAASVLARGYGVLARR
jgi:glycosyltransferase involved in cell wall biosynthesis